MGDDFGTPAFFVCSLIVGVFCAAACAALARRKGLSARTWGWMGFLFGLFGLVALLVIPRNRLGLVEQAIRDGRLKRCPHCASAVPADSVTCRHCGTPLAATPIAVGALPPPPTTRGDGV